jgi:L-iditol 2-dehydrogenase
MVLTGIRKIALLEKPVPDIEKPDQVLIRMKSVGVCGSDVHYYRDGRIGNQVVSYPFTVGHEGAGIIEKTGSGVKGLKPGDRVAVEPSMPCYECDQCREKRFNTCRNMRFLGCPGQAEGCFAEYIVMPATSCIPLPESVSLDQAALSEPLAIGVYAVHLAGDLNNKTIAILGSGPIGMSVLLAAKEKGCRRIFVTDKIDDRLDLARKAGADWTGNPLIEDIVVSINREEALNLDIVFECCGQQEAVDQAVKLLRPGGKLLIAGIPQFDRWTFDAHEIRRKELLFQNVRRQNEMAEKTIGLIAAGSIVPDLMQTHTFSLSEISEAFRIVDTYSDGVMKAMIHI